MHNVNIMNCHYKLYLSLHLIFNIIRMSTTHAQVTLCYMNNNVCHSNRSDIGISGLVQNGNIYRLACHVCMITHLNVRSIKVHSHAVHYASFTVNCEKICPDSKVHGTYMGPTLGEQNPGGPHVGPMILAIWVVYSGQVCPAED